MEQAGKILKDFQAEIDSAQDYRQLDKVFNDIKAHPRRREIVDCLEADIIQKSERAVKLLAYNPSLYRFFENRISAADEKLVEKEMDKAIAPVEKKIKEGGREEAARADINKKIQLLFFIYDEKGDEAHVITSTLAESYKDVVTLPEDKFIRGFLEESYVAHFRLAKANYKERRQSVEQRYSSKPQSNNQPPKP